MRHKNWRHDVLPSSASSLSNGGRRDARPSIKHKALITQSINARCSRGCSFLHIFFLHFSPVQNHNETLRCSRWKWVGEGAQKKKWKLREGKNGAVVNSCRWEVKKSLARKKKSGVFYAEGWVFSRENECEKKCGREKTPPFHYLNLLHSFTSGVA